MLEVAPSLYISRYEAQAVKAFPMSYESPSSVLYAHYLARRNARLASQSLDFPAFSLDSFDLSAAIAELTCTSTPRASNNEFFYTPAAYVASQPQSQSLCATTSALPQANSMPPVQDIRDQSSSTAPICDPPLPAIELSNAGRPKTHVCCLCHKTFDRPSALRKVCTSFPILEASLIL